MGDLKEHGNELFKAGKFAEANQVYTDALKSLAKALSGEASSQEKRPSQEESQLQALQVTLLSNRAACRLKTGDFQGCVDDCSQALEHDPANVKLLYRKAQGELELKHVETAFRDLKRLLEIDKKNSAAVALMQKAKAIAEERNSATSQAMDVVDAAVSTSNEKERTSKLRMVLGTLMEDSHLAKALSMKGVCDKLWSIHEKDSLALKILSKLSEYDGCFEFVLKAVQPEKLCSLVGQESVETEDAASASLNMLWRLLVHEDMEVEKEGGYVRQVDESTVLAVLIGAIRSESESLRRIAVEGVVRVCSDKEARAKSFVELGGMPALMSMIERDFNRNEPLQQVSVVLGQVLPSLKNDDLIKTQAVAFCKVLLQSDNVHDQIKGSAGLDAIFFANRDLGQAVVQEENLLETLKKIARYGSERAQALTAEIFSHMANSEDGRGLLAGEATDILKLLAVSDSAQVRSSAAVTLAKLNALDFNMESENGVLVLSSVMTLLKASATKEEHAKGIEAISFVINDSQVKMMFMNGNGLDVLKELVKLSIESAGEAYAFGLSYIFENLTTSLDDKRREKLREMEVTEEQWEQFEKLTKSQSRKPGQEDPRENVELRIKMLVDIDGISALRTLILKSTSERVWEAAARTLCQIATVQSVRRKMIAQGALKALFKLTTEGSDKCKQNAAHTIAKIFVTTDPHVLKDEQMMDAIGPLVRQVRHSDEDLVIFECCMALTNIATVSFEAKQKMVNVKAIQAFEYAQYSDNLMVRRAATEALNNLIPTEEIVEWISQPEKMRLWLLFATSFEEDPATASAATGALANLAIDERVAKALAGQEESALEKLVGLAGCDNADLVHRAVVCLLNLMDSWPEGNGRSALKQAGAEKVAEKAMKKFGGSPIAEAAQALLTELRNPEPSSG